MKKLDKHKIDSGWYEYQVCITLQYDDYKGHLYIPYQSNKRGIGDFCTDILFNGDGNYESDCDFKQWIDENDDIHILVNLISTNRNGDNLLWTVNGEEELKDFYDLIVGINIVEEQRIS